MGLFGDDNAGIEELMQRQEANRGLYSQIGLPQYKEYVPELFDNESATAHLTSEDPVMKSRQLEALAKLQGLSNEGLSDADVASFNKARQMGDQIAQAKTGAAMQDAQARGVAGGGLEFAMRESGNQQAAQRAQEAALQQAAARSQQRGQYMQAYAQQLGQTRDQDYRADANNTNVINQFNAANTAQRNATSNANVGQRNDAFMYNEGLKDKNYNNQVGQADRIAGINTQEGNLSAAQQEALRRKQKETAGAVGGVLGSYFGPAGSSMGSAAGSAMA